MNPGDMVELLGHPPRTPLRVKVGKQIKDVAPAWRPAIFAAKKYSGLLIFRWTDSLQFTVIHERYARTLVRSPQNGTDSQECYVRVWGELC